MENANETTSYISRTSGLKMQDYVGYAIGDLAGCLVFSLVTSLLQKFYTDIFQLNPLWIMIMLIAARLWDAINDPIMGRICDTIKISKHGRYRPWLRGVAIPLAISGILMFIKWPGLGQSPDEVGTFIYAIFSYVLFGMVYTVLQIPYGSLASVITTDEKERIKLSIFRALGAGVGSIPVFLITSFCYKDRLDANGVAVIGENKNVIQDMMYEPVIIGVVILCLVSAIILFLAFKFTKERVIAVQSEKPQKGQTGKILKVLIKNKSFVAISLTAMLLLAGQMFTQSYYLYLFNDFFGKNWMNLVSVACTYAPIVIFMGVIPKIVRKYGKKEVCATGLALAAVANIAMFACKGLMPDAWWLFLILCFLSGCGISFITLQIWTLATDAIDDIEVKTGVREDGTAYSIFNFFRKLGQMISAIAVNGALLGMSYKTYSGAVQTMETLNVMYDMATIIPAIMFGLMALILFIWYPLNKKRLAELQIEKEAKLKEDYANNKITIK